MANVVQVVARMASGRVASLYDAAVSDNTTTALSTGGPGLNQTSGLSFGQAFPGETITHIAATVQGGASAALNVVYIEGGNGQCKYVVPIGGGGSGELPAVLFPIKVEVGDIVNARACTADATEKDAILGIMCSDRTCAVFQVTAVADTKTELINLIQGSTTFGQALAGKTAVAGFATYNNSGGLNDDGAGNNFFYVEDSAGLLKAAYFPQIVRNGGVYTNGFTEFNKLTYRIEQNDSAYVMWGS